MDGGGIQGWGGGGGVVVGGGVGWAGAAARVPQVAWGQGGVHGLEVPSMRW